MKLIPMVVLAVLLTACGNEVLVVHDNNTPGASFTVIPYVTISDNALGASKEWFRDDRKDVAFASAIEHELSLYGLKILERPAFKFQETTAQGGQGQETSSTKTRMLDVVAMYADTPADYIVVTYADDQRVRIIKKSDRSLVASFQLTNDHQENVSTVHSALIASNLIKGSWTVSKCTVGKP